MISQNINSLIAEAMKAKDAERLSVLRMFSSALNYEKIAKQHDLTKDEEIAVVRREIKKRKDAVLAYKKVNAEDRAAKEQDEITVLSEFLPDELSDEEIEKLVNDGINETGALEIRDMGKVIGYVMSKAGSSVDGSKVSAVVKQKLS